MLNFKNNRVTISAFRADSDFADNYNRHKELVNGLRNLGLKTHTVIGYYKEEGQPEASQELSVQVVDLSYGEMNVVNKLALKYEQDSYLVEDKTNVLLFTPDLEDVQWADYSTLGTEMVEVSKQELIDNGAGTIDGTHCYIAK